jgi:anterior pharynx defective protein 1
MGFSLFIGTFLIALGPASAVFMLVVAPHANLVVVSILSAFFWVCSISLASLLWLGVPESGSGGVVELLLAVLLQVSACASARAFAQR